MKVYDAPAPNPYAVRLFVLERGGIDIDVQQVDIMALENRRLVYRRDVNTRGELQTLRISDDFVLTEIAAICEYLDEVAKGSKSLFGGTAQERAETRMWLRRMDLEIAQPVISWYRGDSRDKGVAVKTATLFICVILSVDLKYVSPSFHDV